MEILDQLKSGLARSNAEERKEWALQIAEGDVDVELLLVLLHTDEKTAQRFTWLITDIAELDSELVIPCMPLLFSLRDQMPFPGMDRSVAKWLLLTNVPEELEREAIAQLFEWMEDQL